MVTETKSLILAGTETIPVDLTTYWIQNIYCPQTKFGEGNTFIDVCLSTGSGGERYAASSHADRFFFWRKHFWKRVQDSSKKGALTIRGENQPNIFAGCIIAHYTTYLTFLKSNLVKEIMRWCDFMTSCHLARSQSVMFFIFWKTRWNERNLIHGRGMCWGAAPTSHPLPLESTTEA